MRPEIEAEMIWEILSRINMHDIKITIDDFEWHMIDTISYQTWSDMYVSYRLFLERKE